MDVRHAHDLVRWFLGIVRGSSLKFREIYALRPGNMPRTPGLARTTLLVKLASTKPSTLNDLSPVDGDCLLRGNNAAEGGRSPTASFRLGSGAGRG